MTSAPRWWHGTSRSDHRDPFTISLGMTDGKVPSVCGPIGDEPWR